MTLLDKLKKMKRWLKKEKVLGIAIGAIFFFAGLLVYSSFKSLLSGGITKITYNPFTMIFITIKTAPLLFIVLLAVGIGIAVLIPKLFKEAEIEDERGFTISNDGTHGTSHYMDDERKRLVFEMKEYDKPDGVILGVDKKTKELITSPWKHKYPKYEPATRNIILFGPPGSRKTTGVLLPNIYEFIQQRYSQVLFDPKGEIYKETIAAAQYYGYDIKILNMQPGQFGYSDGWDMLKLVRESDSPQDMAELMARLFMNNTSEGSEDAFWGPANLNCLKLAILYVAKAKSYSALVKKNSSGNDRTLEAVYKLIVSKDMRAIVEAAINNCDESDDHDKKLLEAPYDIWANHPQAESIRSGLGIRLGFLQNDTLAKVLSEDDIDFKGLSDRPTIIYVICSDQDDTYKAVLTLFASFLFKEVVAYADSRPQAKLERPLYLVFEEMNNIGKIPGLARRVATLRSRDIGMIFCYQDVGQIMSTYSAAHEGKYEYNTIFSGCSFRLCLGGGDQMTREFFSKESGEMTIRDKASAKQLPVYSPLRVAFEERETESNKQRYVLMPSEIKTLGKDEILIFPERENPLRENKYYFRHHPLYGFRMVNVKTGEPVEYTHHYHKPRWYLAYKQAFYKDQTGIERPLESFDDEGEQFEPRYFEEYVLKETSSEDTVQKKLPSWLERMLFKDMDEETEDMHEAKQEEAYISTFDSFRPDYETKRSGIDDSFERAATKADYQIKDKKSPRKKTEVQNDFTYDEEINRRNRRKEENATPAVSREEIIPEFNPCSQTDEDEAMLLSDYDEYDDLSIFGDDARD